MRLPRFLLRRLAQSAILLAVIVVLDFTLLHLAPGDAADAMAGEAGSGDAGYVAQLRARFGLDQPLPVQLGVYVWRLLHLDFGYSFHYATPVAVLILARLPATLLLMAASIGLAVLAGIVLGATQARFPGGWMDRAITLVTLLFYATPLFWLGLMLIVIFAVRLGWLPASGMTEPAGGGGVLDVTRHLVLPALTQSCFFLSIYARLVRASMLEVYGADFVRTARAKGLTERRVAFRHVLRNALMPLITMVGLNLGAALGGAVLTETVFSWPGIGRLMFDAVFQRDVNLLLSILVLSSVLVVLANLAVDLLYLWADPTVEPP